MVKTTFVTRAEDVKVLRRVPVDGVSGFELGGQMGQSRIAWRDGVLIAEQLPNVTFSPPIPLLQAGAAKARKQWRGMVTVLGRSNPGTAVLIQEPESLQLGMKKVKTTRATLTIQSGGNVLDLVTWYQAGEGPVRQEQRTNNRMDVSLESIGAS